jgi:glycosyltransferase involved in cell wall biosynthesis
MAGRVDPIGARSLALAARRLGVEGVVRVTGCLGPEDLSDALSAADALLVLGRSEGFSIPLVDAQQLGVPVVAVEAGALPEVAGSGAWIESADDGPGLAGALLAALAPGDLREARLVAARERALGWSWAASSEALMRVLDDRLR